MVKKYLSFKNFLLLLISMTAVGVAIFNLHDFDFLPGAKAGNHKLERLFRDMDVLQVPRMTAPIESRLKDVDGNEVGFSDFRGKIVFLNFWTTWCPTCLIEMPSMEKLHQKFKDEDFVMVSINLQEPALQVKKFFEEFKLTFTALLDSTAEVAIFFGINAIPATFILDREGSVIGKALGPREWDSRKSIRLFEHLMDESVAASTPGSEQ